MLGLAAMLFIFLAIEETATLWRRFLFLGSALWLGGQSALTFSRGGLYNLAAGIALAFPFLVKDPGTRVKLIVAAVVLLVTCNYALMPALESFTRGTLSARFESVDTTGRLDLFMSDIDLWNENPIWGVGPGQSEYFRRPNMGKIAAHTEFTRLLAEHGLTGFAALLVLLIASLQRISAARSDASKAVVAGMLGWSLCDMLHAGMRIAAPSLAFALAYAALMSEESLRLGFVVTKSTVRKVIADYR
jgi:O-antigen ligase